QPAGFDMASIAASIQHPSSQFVPSLNEAQDALLRQLQSGDVLIVMSAGNAIDLSVELFDSLKEMEEEHG
ncbi:MAG TPA: hypothetical protein VF982_05400, partial [Anaerolineales bacterium]